METQTVNIVAVGPVVTGPADFSPLTPLDVSPAAAVVAADLHLGFCFFCHQPLFQNFVRFMIVRGTNEAGRRRPRNLKGSSFSSGPRPTDYFARAHRSCYESYRGVGQ